VPLTSKKVLFN